MLFTILLLAVCGPLIAQQGQSPQSSQGPTLKGSVEQDVNPRYHTKPDTEAHISQLVGDIIQQVSLTTEKGPPPKFADDVGEYDRYKATKKYGRVAKQYDGCVDKAKEAELHEQKAKEAEAEYDVLRKQLYGRPSPRLRELLATINREEKAAGDRLKEAADCLKSTPAENNIYNQRGSGPPLFGNPQSNRQNNTQQAGTDRNGSLYPRRPEQPLKSPCQPYGPGGYDFCNNPGPPPIGCDCGKRGPQPQFQKPKFDPVQYIKGFLQGMQDCGKMGADLLAAALAFVEGDFKQCAMLLGLQPGQSVFLRTIYQEGTTRRLGISPFDAGRIDGRRICAYAIAPAAARALKAVPGLRTPGATEFNPIKGAAVIENSTELANKWVETPKGAMQFGKLLGDPGKMGTVYELPKQPGRVIKVSNTNPESALSFERQYKGYTELAKTNIPATKIYDKLFGNKGQASFLTMDNVITKWGGKLAQNLERNEVAQVPRAMQRLYEDLGRNDLIWVDGHPLNVAYARLRGQFTAIIIDSDMIFRAEEFNSQPVTVQLRLRTLLREGFDYELPLGATPNALEIMDILYHIRFTKYPMPPL